MELIYRLNEIDLDSYRYAVCVPKGQSPASFSGDDLIGLGVNAKPVAEFWFIFESKEDAAKLILFGHFVLTLEDIIPLIEMEVASRIGKCPKLW